MGKDFPTRYQGMRHRRAQRNPGSAVPEGDAPGLGDSLLSPTVGYGGYRTGRYLRAGRPPPPSGLRQVRHHGFGAGSPAVGRYDGDGILRVRRRSSHDPAHDQRHDRNDARPPQLLIPMDLVERTSPGIQEAFWEEVSEIGWKLERIRLGFDLARVRRAGLLAVEAEAYLFYRQALSENPKGFSPQVRSLLEYAEVAPAWKLARSYQILDETRHRTNELTTTDRHLLALPSTPHPPLPINKPEPDCLADLTAFVNAAGACAVSLPALSVADGPVGLQLVGRPRADRLLLQAACEAE